MTPEFKRGEHKIYLDSEQKKESSVNRFLDGRDCVVKMYEYRDGSGYGSKTKLFLCEDTKHECVSIIRQIWIETLKEWTEEEMSFDADSYCFLDGLINDDPSISGGKFKLLRDYSL